MFLGQFEHSIDEKGRVTIPARFREVLVAEGAYVLQGFDRNLIVLTASAFDQMVKRINQLSLTDTNARLLKRQVFSTAVQVEIDKAGRILIPQFLRQAAQLDTNLMVAGVGDYFEIWSQELWAAQMAKIADVDANEQRFAAVDLSVQL
jgi:MraZ protein